MSTFNVNIEGLRDNVIGSLSSAADSLSSAKSTLSGIDMPDNFSMAGKIKSLANQIGDIKNTVSTCSSSVNGIIANAYNLMRQNNFVLANSPLFTKSFDSSFVNTNIRATTSSTKNTKSTKSNNANSILKLLNDIFNLNKISSTKANNTRPVIDIRPSYQGGGYGVNLTAPDAR